jgi:hypothetical protein
MAELLASGAEEPAEAWDRLTGGFHTLLSLKTLTYPRPFVDAEDARESIRRSLEALDRTSFRERAVRNACAVAEIERRFREQGPSPALHRAVDEMIAALLDEYDAIRLWPEVPPVRRPLASEPAATRFAVGGR